MAGNVNGFRCIWICVLAVCFGSALCSDDFFFFDVHKCRAIAHSQPFGLNWCWNVFHWLCNSLDSSITKMYAQYEVAEFWLASNFNKLLFEYKLDERWLKVLNESLSLRVFFSCSAGSSLLFPSYRETCKHKNGHEFIGARELKYTRQNPREQMYSHIQDESWIRK